MKMRASFVVTVSVMTACAEPKTRKVSSQPPPQGKPVQPDFAKLKPLNPRDPKHGTIYASGARCYVHVPFDEPPTSWRPPKTKAIDCPPSMDDAAWDTCIGGTLYQNTDTKACVCTRDGNPPPPPFEVPCPK
jgi:hypothetical protein